MTKVALPPAAGDTDPAGPTTQYVYDELQRKIREINPNGGVLQFQYSRRGNITGVIDQLGNTLASAYDGEENQLKTTYPNGTGVDIAYDCRNRVTSSLTIGQQLVSLHLFLCPRRYDSCDLKRMVPAQG